MRNFFWIGCVVVLLSGCAAFERGPEGRPSPVEAGAKEFFERASEPSPWAVFGPWGVVATLAMAAGAGVKKGADVLKENRELKQKNGGS